MTQSQWHKHKWFARLDSGRRGLQLYDVLIASNFGELVEVALIDLDSDFCCGSRGDVNPVDTCMDITIKYQPLPFPDRRVLSLKLRKHEGRTRKMTLTIIDRHALSTPTLC
jgi:hypothetical protein